jgi:SAM-dependent methyltransferase/DNA-binding transcriptional ArsR family regulator
MSVSTPSLLDSFSALADPTRCRLLLLLEQHELTVSELCAVLQLPQSTISRQLKTLADAAWVTSRRDGTSRYYALAFGDAEPTGGDGELARTHARIWELTRQQVAARSGAGDDARRLKDVLARRSETSRRFFATAAGEWDRLREDLFGADVSLRAVVGLLPESWVVGELGCGTGAMLALLGPQVARVIGVDGSDEMLAAARFRVAALEHVELRAGSLEALPIETASLDAATMVLVLHHLPAPAVALGEAARVLKPGGRLLIVDMAPHDREQYRRQMGHVWLGFSEEHVRRLLQQAGFTSVRVRDLPPRPDAKGPALFLATAARSAK